MKVERSSSQQRFNVGKLIFPSFVLRVKFQISLYAAAVCGSPVLVSLLFCIEVGFKVLTAVNMKMSVFQVVAPCRLVKVY
jgi:hypothetical protein